MVTLVFQSDSADPGRWTRALQEAWPGLDVRVWPEVGDPAAVDALLVWKIPGDVALRFPNLRLIHLISAGTDQIDRADLPPGVPVARLVEPAQVEGMVEYVLGAVLHYHRDFHRYAAQQKQSLWREHTRTPACERRVGVMGLGSLGRPAAEALVRLGFDLAGWSRTPHGLEGVTGFAGSHALPDFLARSDIVVCMLPLTPDTRGLLDARFFALMRRGACLVNVGRGAICRTGDLIAALASGHLAGATLDVLESEPPAPDDPVWTAPNLVITPHIATSPDPASAAEVVVENLRRALRGETVSTPARLAE